MNSMKLLAGLLSSLLVTIVFALSLNWIFFNNVLQADYLMQKVKETNVGTHISQLMLVQFTAGLDDGAEKKQAEKVVSALFAPGYIESKLETVLTDFESFLKQNGATPKITFQELDGEAKKLGITLPQELTSGSISPSDKIAKQLKADYARVQKFESVGIIAASALFLVLFLISIKRREYGALMSFFYFSAFWHVLAYAFFVYGPNSIYGLIPPAPKITAPLVKGAELLIASVFRDIGQQLLVFGAVFLGIGLVVTGFAWISKLRHKPARRTNAA